MLGSSPAIDIPQSTEYAKEMRKWEATPTRFGPPGRPYQFHEFPKRVYRAERVDGKGVQIVESHTVNTEQEERNLKSRGFYFRQEDAIAAMHAEHTEFGRLAAEREWEIQHHRISEQATAEVRAAEAAHGARHLPAVPATPIKKRAAGVVVTD